MKQIAIALIMGSVHPFKIEQFDLSPAAFAEASIDARLFIDEEINHMYTKPTKSQSDQMWQQKFTNSEFYKNYQNHILVERD